MFIVGGRSLYSMYMDGDRFKQILSTTTNEAYGPWTIDFNNLKLYGTIKQGYTGLTLIISCNYDGSNVTIVTETRSFVIGMTVHRHVLYVFGIYGSVEIFNIKTFTKENNFIATRDFITTLTVYDPEIQPRKGNILDFKYLQLPLTFFR